VIRHQVLPRLWHQREQPLHQHRIRHHHRPRAVPPALLRRIPDPPIRQLPQPRLRNRRPRCVPAKPLQFLAIPRRHPCARVQREPIHLRAQRALDQRLPATIAAGATIARTYSCTERVPARVPALRARTANGVARGDGAQDNGDAGPVAAAARSWRDRSRQAGDPGGVRPRVLHRPRDLARAAALCGGGTPHPFARVSFCRGR